MRNVKEFTLLVNGKEIDCKDFVEDIIGNGIIGMVESLDLEDPKIKDLNIKIKYFE